MACKISVWTLWHFYKWNDVSYRTGKAVYRQVFDQSARLRVERASFARLMGNLLRDKVRQDALIYVDETTYSTV